MDIFKYTRSLLQEAMDLARTIGGMQYLRTNEAAHAIGVSRQTLLRWFREKKVKDVRRDRKGWRLFSRHDVSRLKRWAESGG